MFTCERLPLFLFESATRAREVFITGNPLKDKSIICENIFSTE